MILLWLTAGRPRSLHHCHSRLHSLHRHAFTVWRTASVAWATYVNMGVLSYTRHGLCCASRLDLRKHWRLTCGKSCSRHSCVCPLKTSCTCSRTKSKGLTDHERHPSKSEPTLTLSVCHTRHRCDSGLHINRTVCPCCSRNNSRTL